MSKNKQAIQKRENTNVQCTHETRTSKQENRNLKQDVFFYSSGWQTFKTTAYGEEIKSPLVPLAESFNDREIMEDILVTSKLKVGKP